MKHGIIYRLQLGKPKITRELGDVNKEITNMIWLRKPEVLKIKVDHAHCIIHVISYFGNTPVFKGSEGKQIVISMLPVSLNNGNASSSTVGLYPDLNLWEHPEPPLSLCTKFVLLIHSLCFNSRMLASRNYW